MKATRKRNPYRVPKGFVANPFTPLYHEPDLEPSEDLSVQEILDYALTLEGQIPGDFNLSQIVNEIKSNSLSFVRTGLLAYKVKVYKIYRNVHRNFKEFCEKALGISHWQINRTIEAARVVVELAQNGFDILPKCEAQCRPLSKFSGAQLCANWQIVLDTTPAHRITGKAINEALGIETTSMSVQIAPKLYYRIKAQAVEAGMSFHAFLETTFGDHTEVQKVEPEKLDEWEEDLQALVHEQEKSPSQETENLNEQNGELVNKEASNDQTLVDSTSPLPALDEPLIEPGLNTESRAKDLETESVIINGFGILSGCKAQSGLLANFSDSKLCANWLSFLDSTSATKITGSSTSGVAGMERELMEVTISEELYNRINEEAQSAGMSIEELLEAKLGINDTTDEGAQAAQKKPKRRATKHKRGFG